MADLQRQPPVDKSGRKPSDWWSGSKRWTRYWYLRLMRQNSSPKNLAAALALGMFIGAMPIIPLQSVVVIALAFVFRVNKLAAWLATCYSNVATMAPFYFFLYKIGMLVTPFNNVVFDTDQLNLRNWFGMGLEHFWDTGVSFFVVMFAGGLAFGIPATIATYFLSLFIIRRYRERRALQLLKKRTGSG